MYAKKLSSKINLAFFILLIIETNIHIATNRFGIWTGLVCFILQRLGYFRDLKNPLPVSFLAVS